MGSTMMSDRFLVSPFEMSALTCSDVCASDEVMVLETSACLNSKRLRLAVSRLSEG
jgi:hypothetical protein